MRWRTADGQWHGRPRLPKRLWGPRPSIVCSLLLARNAFCLSAADPSAFGLPFAKHNTPSLPPFDRIVADRRRRKRANSRISWGGAPQAMGGAASDDIRRWHWQFVKSQKEPTHVFNERALPNLLRVVLDANTHSLVVREHPYYSLPSCHAPPRVGGGSSRNSRDKFSKMNH